MKRIGGKDILPVFSPISRNEPKNGNLTSLSS